MFFVISFIFLRLLIMFIKVFRPSIACEIITIGSGTINPNKVEKYTKGLTQLFKSTAKIRQFCEVAKFIFTLGRV